MGRYAAMGRGTPAVIKPPTIFREFDALAYDGKRQEVQGDKKAAVNHVAKRHRSNKGAEVVFDPKGHRCGM